ncbi:MAG TPA: cytochrome c3 family protein [Phycisphaerae bacterium]|nr:cytochrome c3 family protein [Phycisphaerae bacterium]
MPYKPKPLWDRFNLYYALRVHRERLLKRALAAGGALLAAGWMIATFVRGDERPFSSGPMSIGHAMLADNCAECHTQSTRFARFWNLSDADKAHTLNEGCLRCHGPTIGHDAGTQSAWHQLSALHAASYPDAREPRAACSSCHAEHEGFVRLTEMDDRHCTSCHADLRPLDAGSPFARSITQFGKRGRDGDHPEFRALSRPDPGRLRFSHETHMDRSKRPFSGIPGEPLSCDDCHRAGDSQRPWRFGLARVLGVDRLPHELASASADEVDKSGAFMQPIRYELHCAACHPLDVGRLYPIRGTPDGWVAHSTPGEIRSGIIGQLLRFLREPSETPPPESDLEPRPAAGADGRMDPGDELRYIARNAVTIERALYSSSTGTCVKCHAIDYSPPPRGTGSAWETPLAVVAPTAIPRRWFLHGSFSHARHKTVGPLVRAVPGAVAAADAGCTHCHPGAMASRQSADVLLPSVDACRECHAPAQRGGGRSLGGVSDRCVYCHTFHRPPSPELREGAAAATQGGLP